MGVLRGYTLVIYKEASYFFMLLPLMMEVNRGVSVIARNRVKECKSKIAFGNYQEFFSFEALVVLQGDLFNINLCLLIIFINMVLLKFWYIYVSKFEETFICKREIDALPPIIRFAVFILLTEPSRIPLFNLLAIELLMAE